MMSILRLVGVYLRISILNELQYRVNFFIQILHALIALGTGLIGLALLAMALLAVGLRFRANRV